MYLYDLTLFGGLELLVFFGLLTAAVCYEIVALPFIVIAAFMFIAAYVNGIDFSHFVYWIRDNEFLTVLGVLGYLCIGVAWSFLKWQIKLSDLLKVGKDLLNKDSEQPFAKEVNLNPLKFDYYFKRVTGFSYPVRASTSKNHITTWMAFWPISMITTAIGDWLVRIWDKLYELLGTVFQSMADKKLNSLYVETEKNTAAHLAKIDEISNRGSTRR